MGFFDNIFGAGRARSLVDVDLGIQSPWAEPGDLGRIVLSDLIGADIANQLPLTRGEALSIPAVSAVYNLLMSSAASLPLVALDKDGVPLDVQPNVLNRQDSSALYLVKGGLIGDLLFDGGSLLRCELGSDGFPLSMEHIGRDRWKTDDKGRFIVDGRAQDPDQMFYVPSLFPGLLNIGGRTLRAARDIEITIAQRSLNSAPVNVLSLIVDEEITDEEREQVLREFNGMAHTPGGATVFLPRGIKYDKVSDDPSNFLLEARNAVALNIAQLVGLPSQLVESQAAQGTNNYTTEKGQRSRFEDFSLNLWLNPIESRLSQSDFSPNGQRIAFDTTQLTGTPSPTAGPDVFERRQPEQTAAPIAPPQETE